MTLHLREYISIPYIPGYGHCICPKCICETVVDCFVHICDCCLTDNDDGTWVQMKFIKWFWQLYDWRYWIVALLAVIYFIYIVYIVVRCDFNLGHLDPYNRGVCTP